MSKEKTKCEVEGCEKQQWKDHRCMRHYNEKHGIEKHGKAGRKPKIATPGARKDNPGNPESDDVLSKLIIKRDEHRQALLELEAILNGISKYSGTIIPE